MFEGPSCTACVDFCAVIFVCDDVLHFTVAVQNLTGLFLAVSSSLFIGASFIIKKKGLRRAGSTGLRAGSGGYSYLKEPLWWTGMLAMVFGEAANFAAYGFAPAILVTPLGALSVIVSAVLAHLLLKEYLNPFGVLGCILCITGSLAIVLQAPEDAPVSSVLEVWGRAVQPSFLLYALAVVTCSFYLIWRVPLEVQTSNVVIYIGVCSMIGSLSVMACKGLSTALKLTLEGHNQLVYFQTHFFLGVLICCVVTQMNYLNKALDLFNTAIVTPIYYVMFTSLTIAASMIMFHEEQSMADVVTELSGFATIVCGTFLLHSTKDLDVSLEMLLGAAGLQFPSSRDGQSASNDDVVVSKKIEVEDDVEMAPLTRRLSGFGQRKTQIAT